MHLQRGNRTGATRVLARARQTLRAAPPIDDFPTPALESALDALAALLGSGAQVEPATLPRALA